MRRALHKGALAALVFVGLLRAEYSQAVPYGYGTPTPGAVQAGIRQERWIDPININRLLNFVPSSLRAKAKQDFTSWNERQKKAPRDLTEKFARAKNKAAQQQVSLKAYEEQKALAFDKLALFERYRIGHFFFAPGAKNLTARVKYLQDIFKSMDSRQRASTNPPTFASMFPATSEYLTALGNGTTYLLNTIGGVDCAHADEDCPQASSAAVCEKGESLCTPFSVEVLPYKPATGGPEIQRGLAEGTLLGCGQNAADLASRGGAVLLSVHAIAETHYVCADPSKNASGSAMRALQAQVFVDSVHCRNDKTGLRTFGIYAFEPQIEDGPIPDGCVGINKVLTVSPKEELAEGSMVLLNAAPCWEEHWQCRYDADPFAEVTDTEQIKIPDVPRC